MTILNNFSRYIYAKLIMDLSFKRLSFTNIKSEVRFARLVIVFDTRRHQCTKRILL